MVYFLIGFMGSGKSHWAKIWAAENHMGFVELDRLIEMEEAMSVADIFERRGEAYFREREAEKLRECASLQNTIVSCGGGTPCFHDNIQWMNATGKTIYLQAFPEEILRRLLRGQQERPLINKFNQAELLFFIQNKLKERERFYQMATLTLLSTELTDHTFKEIIA